MDEGSISLCFTRSSSYPSKWVGFTTKCRVEAVFENEMKSHFVQWKYLKWRPLLLREFLTAEVKPLYNINIISILTNAYAKSRIWLYEKKANSVKFCIIRITIWNVKTNAVNREVYLKIFSSDLWMNRKSLSMHRTSSTNSFCCEYVNWSTMYELWSCYNFSPFSSAEICISKRLTIFLNSVK